MDSRFNAFSDSGGVMAAENNELVMKWKDRHFSDLYAIVMDPNTAPTYTFDNGYSALSFDGLDDGNGDLMEAWLIMERSKSFVVVFEDKGTSSGCCKSIINTGEQGEFVGIGISDNKLFLDHNGVTLTSEVDPFNQLLIIVATFNENGEAKLYVNGELEQSESEIDVGLSSTVIIGARQPQEFYDRLVFSFCK